MSPTDPSRLLSNQRLSPPPLNPAIHSSNVPSNVFPLPDHRLDPFFRFEVSGSTSSGSFPSYRNGAGTQSHFELSSSSSSSGQSSRNRSTPVSSRVSHQPQSGPIAIPVLLHKRLNIPTQTRPSPKPASTSPSLGKSISQSRDILSPLFRSPFVSKRQTKMTSNPLPLMTNRAGPRMVFQTHQNYLSATVEAEFENNGRVDMIGGANTSTSYSVPGHIIITLPALPPVLRGRARVVEQLKIVMEGKSEFWDDQGRYTPMRLYTTTLVLASKEKPLIVPSHDLSDPNSSSIRLAVAFDLRLPGWLPPSHDSDLTTVAYGARVDTCSRWKETSNLESGSALSLAEMLDSEYSTTGSTSNGSPKSRRKSSFDSIFSNQSLNLELLHRSSSKYTPFTIHRHCFPTSITGQPARIVDRQYLLFADADSKSPVECVLLIPEWVDINGEERSLKVKLKVRHRPGVAAAQRPEASRRISAPVGPSPTPTTGLSEGPNSTTPGRAGPLESVPMERQTKVITDEIFVNMLELGMEIDEVERFSSTPFASFASAFPIPDNQPSRHSAENQLLSPRSAYVDGGLFGRNDSSFKGIRTRGCLLTDTGEQRTFQFADGGLGLGDRWRTINVLLPMPEELADNNNTRPQVEIDGPFLKIKHLLKVRMVCQSIGSSESTAVTFSTPIRFGTSVRTMPTTGPKMAPLPAYIQLFHENGDPRPGEPVPAYSAPVALSTASPPRPQTASTNVSPPLSPVPTYESLFPESYTTPSSSRSPSPSTSSTISNDYPSEQSSPANTPPSSPPWKTNRWTSIPSRATPVGNKAPKTAYVQLPCQWSHLERLFALHGDLEGSRESPWRSAGEPQIRSD